eukprot:NODE_1086_length_1019_cov_94.539238_g1041_i0.p1 GENE.NODE_1086_length_1019_cov_94.539238_g1041_i0~~NODE_1086_length_1019_cov_94.539238_g1041_i0.p1  ORF type:complete len:313 (+),score=35.74 NODE_1086_length_1019_cov_94.539238_g1041_i0:78-1016(+)
MERPTNFTFKPAITRRASNTARTNGPLIDRLYTAPLRKRQQGIVELPESVDEDWEDRLQAHEAVLTFESGSNEATEAPKKKITDEEFGRLYESFMNYKENAEGRRQATIHKQLAKEASMHTPKINQRSRKLAQRVRQSTSASVWQNLHEGPTSSAHRSSPQRSGPSPRSKSGDSRSLAKIEMLTPRGAPPARPSGGGAARRSRTEPAALYPPSDRSSPLALGPEAFATPDVSNISVDTISSNPMGMFHQPTMPPGGPVPGFYSGTQTSGYWPSAPVATPNISTQPFASPFGARPMMYPGMTGGAGYPRFGLC